MTDYVSSPHLDRLEAVYDQAIANLRSAIQAYIFEGTLPDPAWRTDGSFAYPEIRIRYHGDPAKSPIGRAWGRLSTAGTYAMSITQPRLFRAYMGEQLDFLLRNYDLDIDVGPSRQEIPFGYVLGEGVDVGDVAAADLARYFPAPELAHIGDEIADGIWQLGSGGTLPLSLFDGLRTDFSLARLAHYTGTRPEHFQRYILFTNYQRYVDTFIRWGVEQVQDGDSRYTALAGAGGLFATAEEGDADAAVADGMYRRFQMPAYHLVAEGNTGITLVNIGVGPSNAKTITSPCCGPRRG